MRDLIKMIFALAFMALAFFVGKYLSGEKHAVQLNQANETSKNYKKQIIQLHDSITLLEAELVKINSARKIDSMVVEKRNNEALKKGRTANKGYIQ